MSPTGESCYSGGMDGTIRCWNIPNSNIDPYDSFGKTLSFLLCINLVYSDNLLTISHVVGYSMNFILTMHTVVDS